MARTPLSAEERAARAAELQQQLTDKVAALRSSEEWISYLKIASRLHKSYSLSNILLILAQRPDATQVAGYRAWQAAGRQVRLGETSIKIRGYSTKKITVAATGCDAGEDEADGEIRRVARFPVVGVFDIAQTDPIAGVWVEPVSLVKGGDDIGLADSAAQWLRSQGWAVETGETGSANGVTYPASRQVVISQKLSGAARAKTMLHEAAHAFLHADQPRGHRGVAETEAESVAYVLAHLFGLDTSCYSVGYVAGWSEADPTMVQAAAANVLRAVNAIDAGIAPYLAASAAVAA